MAAVPATIAITLFVDDPERARSFYEDVFGVPPILADDDSVAFRFESTIVNQDRGGELIEPGVVAGQLGRPDAA